MNRVNPLLPIIRRKRKPLLVVDTLPAMLGNVEPVEAVADDRSTANDPTPVVNPEEDSTE